MTRAEIRPAYPKDSAAIAALLGQLGYPTEAGDVAVRLGHLQASDSSEVLVAIVEGVVVFYAAQGYEFTARRYSKSVQPPA